MTTTGAGGSPAPGRSPAGAGGTTPHGRSPDAPLLRRVRVRLILWSGGSTLVLLAVLGTLLYGATAARLRDESIEQLTTRAAGLRLTAQSAPPGDRFFSIPVTSDPGLPGMIVGGPLSGTIAVVGTTDQGGPFPVPIVIQGQGVPAEAGGTGDVVIGGPVDRPVLSTGVGLGAGPDPGAEPVSIPATDEPVITERTIGGLPVRLLVERVDVGGQHLALQVISDRSSEVRTLDTLLFVLVVGSLLVVAAAALLGYVYAGRALVPIRSSLERQREFAADASHELRTPLAVMATAIEHLKRRRDDPEAVDRAIADIERGSGRLTGMVDDLLLLARADSDAVELTLAPVDLAELSGEALAGFEALAAERGVGLRLDIEPAQVRGDAARLRQLAGILVDNAVKHSPGGGTVTLRVRPGASLEVEDEGPGIRTEDLPHVFHRFWRAADAPPGGTGLGLAIAEWIAISHGGRIGAANRPERGARFTVTIPGFAGEHPADRPPA